MTAEEMTMEQELQRKNKILALVKDPDQTKKDIFMLEQMFRFDDDIQEIKGDVKVLQSSCIKLPFKVDKKRAAGITTAIVAIATAVSQLL